VRVWVQVLEHASGQESVLVWVQALEQASEQESVKVLALASVQVL